jgi:uncharacterized membrane protein YhaH (DUF805 family)
LNARGREAYPTNETRGATLNWYVEVLKKYAVFSGRAGRPEFWYFVLFNAIVAFALAILDVVLGTVSSGNVGLFYSIYLLAVLLPCIGVGIRRLHDTNRSGWWLLIELIPIVGLILIGWWIIESDAGPNQYGAGPSAIGA